MQCPFCGHRESKVIDSRHSDSSSIRRRRECEQCKRRFTTYEKIEMAPLMVIKKDSNREIFDRGKIKYGIIKACEKRPVSNEDIEKLVHDIEINIKSKYSGEVESKVIGEMVMDGLKELDEVAYIRFASVYRQFKDRSTFVSELQNIITEKDD
ncbi:transcriptional repressor NrdR [Peptacetobacter hominis]|uniref:Transcriptional repressor NrdR n=1 Tax=Peptacetobacter hominis TaxID=2743610 RepID=A0A544QUU4_9FIRM|nr:transcriptional regulator NrdR [Peptacetobacter hominis]TQQ84471.1 transcriptional repressor NrdR [Peptacetobacter hominis]